MTDLKNVGYEQGQFNTLYNVLQNKLRSTPNLTYFIETISADRTELILNSTSLTPGEITISVEEYISEIQDSEFKEDFYLNFGNNQLLLCTNILLDNSDELNPKILIKLYESLPNNFSKNSECWVVEKASNSFAYNIDISVDFSDENNNIKLKGPNLNLQIKDNINNSTEYKTLNLLNTTTNSQGSGSLQYRLNNIISQKGLNINIDYNEYSNFIQFSSAQTRLENFYYKLGLIEEYTVSSSYSSNNNSGSFYVSSSNNIWQNKIDEIITGFDGYEQFLYFESGSKSWPKTNSNIPYINAPTSNPGVGYNFLLTQSISASSYDNENNNALINSIPSYLREDPNNDKYELFIEMLGQQFDNIYLYLQDVTNKYNTDNRLNFGVSKDLVADIIRDFGVKIYQNNFSVDDLIHRSY